MWKKSKHREMLTGYLMVLPALLIVAGISIFPLFQTLFFSMFDYQLNNPAKNEIILDNRLDLEQYVDAQFYLDKCLAELRQLENGADSMQPLYDAIGRLNETVLQTEEVAVRYDAVRAAVDQMQPVRDLELKYVPLSDAQASALEENVDAIVAMLRELQEEENDVFRKTIDIMLQIRAGVLTSNFIGFDNYIDLGRQLGVRNGALGRLGRSILNTVGFTVVTVLIELTLGMAIALMAGKAFRGRGLIRTCMLVPWAIPTVVSAMMWKFMYDGQSGVIAHLLEVLGCVSDAGVVMGTSVGSVVGIIVADVWKTTPYMALLLLAGLQLIPQELYESAQIDGATGWKQFMHITLPMIRPTLLVALLFRSMDAFRIFDLIYVMTGGGPGYSTESISIYAYKTMFSQMDFGKGSAIAVILFLCVFIMSCFYIRMMRNNLAEKEP